ncbi:MAG TPA: MerR family transcriptional regulator [Steroidobacteraceae bacterium]|nr:MerR family transcriptional regulator [Steroidobacteraceae bacterium]
MAGLEDRAEYSIRAVSRATGLSTETLRAWERRYGAIEPKRDGSGHRLYTACDVFRLRRLREITDRGHPIGKIAHLSNEDLSRLLAEAPAEEADSAVEQSLIGRMLRTADRFRPAECDQVIAMAFALLPADEVVRKVLAPALREVGERWHSGEFSIGQERIASSAARRQLTTLLNTFNSIARGPSIVFATLSGEQHELGILMHAALAASHLLRAYYLGPDVPPEEIANYARRVGAAAVAVSLVMPAALESFLTQLAELRGALPGHVEIWIGGSAASGVEPRRFPEATVLMREGADFDQRVELLVAASAGPLPGSS